MSQLEQRDSMACYPDSERCESVVDILRSMTDAGEAPCTRDLIARCVPSMAYKTAWKAIRMLRDEGVIEAEPGRKQVTGKPCDFLHLDWWYEMNEDQRERMVAALEDIAASLRMQTGRTMQRETKAARADETKEADA